MSSTADAIEQDGEDALGELVNRSHRLGADRSVANWGGGNTSTKATQIDFRGRPSEVLWVKGSGSDLATMNRSGFAGLRLDDIMPLLEREAMSDEEMVAYLAHCPIGPGFPRPSIETLLHAFLPARQIDHTHPDATNWLACATDGERLARELFGDELVWIPYIRPGFALSRQVALAVRDNPRCKLVILAKHGLITWGDDSAACERSTWERVERARRFVETRMKARTPFGGARYETLPLERRRDILVSILPALRGAVSAERRTILRYDDTGDVLSFVNSIDAPRLVHVGAACPDHLVHTKPWPLLIEWDPQSGDTVSLRQALLAGVSSYAERYRAYTAENSHPGDPQGDPYPRVILIPGIGMITTGKDAFNASVSSALYHRAISVMAGAEACGGFVSLTPSEAYNVEYWPLELYKLSLAPQERDLARRVAFVTGGAGGIGSAIAERLAADGAHVVLADLNEDGAREVAAGLTARFGVGRAVAVRTNVTDEEAIRRAYEEAILTYGGIDILVSNAGLASSAPIEETSLSEWQRNIDVLMTGYFLVSREAFRVLKAQGRGGALVYIASKNALVAGKNAAAYSAAKAAEIHLARCLAEEGGAVGIRVNTVNPDAVLQGSQIWNSSWREERARNYGIGPEELEEYYRKRTTLKVNILPSDIAEAVAFLASDRTAKSTGNIINVDGGVAAAYPR